MGGKSATHVGHAGLCPREPTRKRPLLATLSNEFAGQALCRQKSHGLTHHRAWSQPRRAAKIKKLRVSQSDMTVGLDGPMSPSFVWASSEEPDHPRMSGWGSSAYALTYHPLPARRGVTTTPPRGTGRSVGTASQPYLYPAVLRNSTQRPGLGSSCAVRGWIIMGCCCCRCCTNWSLCWCGET
jgi:hypothetical protein